MIEEIVDCLEILTLQIEGRSNERTLRERRPYEDRRHIVCYKCNNLGHIDQNCHAPDDQ